MQTGRYTCIYIILAPLYKPISEEHIYIYIYIYIYRAATPGYSSRSDTGYIRSKSADSAVRDRMSAWAQFGSNVREYLKRLLSQRESNETQQGVIGIAMQPGLRGCAWRERGRPMQFAV